MWSSGHPAFWSSHHTAFWPSGHPDFWPADHLVIRLSGHPNFWPSGLLAIQSCSHPAIWSSSHPVFWPSGHPNFWPFVLMSQKCPYWDIFGLPCRLHQSQIPNVLLGAFGLSTFCIVYYILHILRIWCSFAVSISFDSPTFLENCLIYFILDRAAR